MLRLSTTDKVSYAYCLQGVASKNAALTENSILSVKFNVPFFLISSLKANIIQVPTDINEFFLKRNPSLKLQLGYAKLAEFHSSLFNQ